MNSGIEPSPSAQLVSRVARSGAWNVIGYAATAGAALGVSIIAARKLGPSGYGDYSYLMWIVRTGAVLGALGIPAAATRVISESLGANHPALSRSFFRTALVFHSMLVPLLFLVVTAAVWARVETVVAVGLGGATVALSLVYTFEQSLAGFRRFQLAARNASIVAVSQLSLVTVAAVTGAGLTGFLYLQILAAAVAVAVWGGITVSAFSKFGVTHLPAKARKDFIKLAGMMAVVSLSDGILWGRPELFFLERWWSQREVGLYSAALVLATLTSSLPLIASRVLTPEFSWLRGGGQETTLRNAFPKVCTYVALVAIPLGLGGAIVSRDLLISAFGASYGPAALTASIAMAGSVFVAVAGPASSATVTGPNPGFMAQLAVGLALVNLTLDFLLIRSFGMVGAASATIASQAISIVIVIIYVKRRLKLSYPFSNLAKIAVASVVAVAVGRSLAGAREGALALSITIPVSLVLYPTLVLLFRVVDFGELKQVLRRRSVVRADEES